MNITTAHIERLIKIMEKKNVSINELLPLLMKVVYPEVREVRETAEIE